MNGSKSFASNVGTVGTFSAKADAIKHEPMFFNCSFDWAWEFGGDITRSFLDALPAGWDEDVVFDSRIHMLMPGWYPGIPGWHHDDVPRAEIPPGQHFLTAGQPDYDNPRYHAEHIMGLVNADVCPTAFAVGRCVLQPVPDGELIYRQWHQEVEELITIGQLERYEAPTNTLLRFDWQTFHACQKARKNGWRWFGRVSRHTDRVKSITNEIRRNAQVYLEFPMEGW